MNKNLLPLGWSIPEEYLEKLRVTYEVEVPTYCASDDTDTDRLLPSDNWEDEFADHGVGLLDILMSPCGVKATIFYGLPF